MPNVVLVSVLGPPRLLCGTHDLPYMRTWFNTTPRYYPGYICNRIKFLTGETFLAISHDTTPTGYVSITRNQGHNWQVASTFPGNQITTMEVGAGFAWISTGSGVYRSSNGSNWTFMGGPGGVRNFVVLPSGRIMAHTGAKLYRSYNLGSNWEEIHSPIRGGIYPWWDTTVDPGSASFAIAGNNSRIIASNGPTLYESTNFGDSWSKIITWSTWYIPRELHYTRGSTFILKMRTLNPGESAINNIMVSSDNCRSFTTKFVQDVTWEHQIEYIPAFNMVLVGHTRYMEPEPWETWLARFVPAIMYSLNNGQSFTEVVSDTFEQTFSIIAICGGVSNPEEYNMDVILRKWRRKNYSVTTTFKSIKGSNIEMDLLAKKTIPQQYYIDSLLKGTVYHNYLADSLVQKHIENTYTMSPPPLAIRQYEDYNMLARFKKRWHKPLPIDLLTKKTVDRGYGAKMLLVGDYKTPLKRELMLLFPQPYALEMENINYVLRKDIMKRRIDQHGY